MQKEIINEEQLREFLAKNLKISVTEKTSYSGNDQCLTVSVYLSEEKLHDEYDIAKVAICADYVYLK